MGLIGESPLRDGRTGIGWTPHHGDALPFISTNAMTVAIAGDTSIEVAGWLQHCLVVSVLSVLASRSSVEPFAAQVQSARMHFGQAEVAERVRDLLAPHDITPVRVQDSFGFRAPTANLGCHLASGASTAEHAEYRDEFVFGESAGVGRRRHGVSQRKFPRNANSPCSRRGEVGGRQCCPALAMSARQPLRPRSHRPSCVPCRRSRRQQRNHASRIHDFCCHCRDPLVGGTGVVGPHGNFARHRGSRKFRIPSCNSIGGHSCPISIGAGV